MVKPFLVVRDVYGSVRAFSDQSASRAAIAGMTITAATTWVRPSTTLVAVSVSTNAGGTIDRALSATVVTTKV